MGELLLDNSYLDRFPEWEPGVQAARVDPLKHTMTEQAFYGYIGRRRGVFRGHPGEQSDREIQYRYRINSKKFSENQKEAIKQAYRRRLTIRVFGAVSDYAEYIASEMSFEINYSNFEVHYRDKIFNRNRASSIFAKKLDGIEELWFFVFPSREYVDQFAELVQAILDDISREERNDYMASVIVMHFPELEKGLVVWSGFEQEVMPYVRYGDVVAIGHVTDFAATLKEIGFRSLSGDWNFFGYNDMFGAQVFVSDLNNRRIVLLGFRESFWGSASGYYASSLLKAGARHILYGSKAATMIDEEYVSSIAAPSVFYNLISGVLENPKVPDPSKAQSMLESLRITQITTSLTVPTVIGETKKLISDYDHLGSTCMDCENGHIAEAVNRFNTSLKDRNGTYAIEACFVPVHYITDYIHTKSERGGRAAKAWSSFKSRLGFDPASERRSEITEAFDDTEKAKRSQKKTESFAQIGAFFGYYTHIFGLTESFRAPLIDRYDRLDVAREEVNVRFTRIRASLQAGYSHAVLTELLEDYRQGEKSLESLLVIALTAQKCGFLSLLDGIEQRLRSLDLSNAPLDLLNALDVISLKKSTQRGNMIGARRLIDKVDEQNRGEAVLIENLGRIDQLKPFNRRRNLVIISETDPAIKKQEALESISQGSQSKNYNSLTDGFFATVGLLFSLRHAASRSWILNPVSQWLRAIRQDYYELGDSQDLWMHAHREKAAIAALFLEAAFYLGGSKSQRELGLNKLYIAHLFNMRFGGNERSEGYGEVIWAAQNVAVRDIVACAMRRDPYHQAKFQRLITDGNVIGTKFMFSQCCEIFLLVDKLAQVAGMNDLIGKYDWVADG